MSGGGKRIAKELGDVNTTPPAGMTVSLVDESNLHDWRIVIDGPAGSPYEGGKFTLSLLLPKEYPFKPPTINFKTRIYHPNITSDDKGSMCLGILKGDQWKPSSRIVSVLEAAQQLLIEPNPDDAINGDAAELFNKKREEFAKTAKDWTSRYAIGTN